MNDTKRQCDPLGRSAPAWRYRLHALCLAIAITGSAWPIWARSIRAAFDTGLSAKRFAELHRVPVTRVYQWCSRLRRNGKRRAREASAAPRLVEVELPAVRDRTLGADRIDIELLSGRRLSVPEGVSLERVAALVTLLERQ